MRPLPPLFLPLILTALFSLPVTGEVNDFDPFAAAEQSGSSSRMEFLSEVRSIAPGQPFHLAIKLTHPPGWHSYFINTGFVGMPLQPNWKLPPGFNASRVAWPVPHIGSTAGQKTYGYEPLVYHLFKVTPPSNLRVGDQVTVGAAPRWQICDENNCLPEPGFGKPDASSQITLPVAAEAAIAPANAPAFAAARAMLPEPLPENITVQASRTASEISILLSPADAVPEGKIHFFDYEQVMDAQSDPVVTRGEDGVRWTIARNEESDSNTTSTLGGILTLGEHGYIVEAEYGATVSPPVSFSKLLTILGGMFLGGMILNLMPCVFPVIGIKIMGFVQQAGEDRRTILVHGLIYAAGVLLSFWVLSGLLLALREGAIHSEGQDISWGYQLQNPWVLWALMLVMFILAMNMFGVFEIGTSATSAGSNLTHKQGFGGSFFSGVLATVVATPCSAPFLGVAIGLAFSLSPVLFLLAFTMMALGLAFPYVLLSAFPKLVEKLPRPGPWMESFKQAMAFLLFGTTGFLLWSFLSLNDVGLGKMLPIVVGLTFVGISLWVYGRWCVVSRGRRARVIGYLATILFCGSGLWASKPPSKGLEWKTWSPEAVEEAIGAGRPVYVDFTATWCATCQVNKSMGYNKGVQKLFEAHNILALKADYTDYDPRIAETIAGLKRRAVPVNALYIPDDPDPKLTKEFFNSGYMKGFISKHLGEPGPPAGRR
ncbi:MAG: thioredoxin family protein [Roseibacillus sp.]|nr:thioredoxin family protein [Roseibacillus sp.]